MLRQVVACVLWDKEGTQVIYTSESPVDGIPPSGSAFWLSRSSSILNPDALAHLHSPNPCLSAAQSSKKHWKPQPG